MGPSRDASNVPACARSVAALAPTSEAVALPRKFGTEAPAFPLSACRGTARMSGSRA